MKKELCQLCVNYTYDYDHYAWYTKNTEDYKNKCLKNDFSWSISRPAPSESKNSAYSTYQYLQNFQI